MPNSNLTREGSISAGQTRPYTGQPLPKPQSDIVIGRKKGPFSFKNAWDKFYTGVVNTQQAIYNAAKSNVVSEFD